ncbi:hypothetical protein [Halomonas piscis]|uniref:hypothetical protein n=1 Tax=Halomonas piscis TaxID=3031727 RepID=UPI002898A5B4|nr:hypothetical protein [Halomonas piscis]
MTQGGTPLSVIGERQRYARRGRLCRALWEAGFAGRCARHFWQGVVGILLLLLVLSWVLR